MLKVTFLFSVTVALATEPLCKVAQNQDEVSMLQVGITQHKAAPKDSSKPCCFGCNCGDSKPKKGSLEWAAQKKDKDDANRELLRQLRAQNGIHEPLEIAPAVVSDQPQKPHLDPYNADTDAITMHVIELTDFLDRHPNQYDEAKFLKYGNEYAAFGHELNYALIKSSYPVVNVEQRLEPVDLASFLPHLAEALHPAPAYEEIVYRNGEGHMPFAVPSIQKGVVTDDVHIVHQFLSTTKEQTRHTDIRIHPKPGGRFRDISGEALGDDKNEMKEVLGMLGLRLQYVSVPTAEVPFHVFNEV